MTKDPQPLPRKVPPLSIEITASPDLGVRVVGRGDPGKLAAWLRQDGEARGLVTHALSVGRRPQPRAIDESDVAALIAAAEAGPS